ncbi:MAG: AsnC family transcriptional regulator [Thermoplasmata archaeon]
MDALDYAIYRHLSPDGQIRFWGSRRTVDPRVSAREISTKVGLSETGVRSRLRALERRGFLRGRETWVNPALFGVTLTVCDIPVTGSQEAERLLREVALVDGVTFARDIMDERNREIRVYYISDSVAETARRTALLRRLGASEQFRGPTAYWLPSCSRALTRLDWRILSAFRQHPDAGASELASEVGISVKTAAARFHQLLDSRACWSSLSSASEEMPLALLSVQVREGSSRSEVAHRIAGGHPGWMPVARDGLGEAPERPLTSLVGLVPAEAPAALERAIRRTLDIEGVADLHRTFALGSSSYPQWMDERLAESMRART